jgi:hypothetical protein
MMVSEKNPTAGSTKLLLLKGTEKIVQARTAWVFGADVLLEGKKVKGQ